MTQRHKWTGGGRIRNADGSRQKDAECCCEENTNPEIPDCATCVNPNVPRQATLLLPNDAFVDPATGSPCQECLDLNGGTFVYDYDENASFSGQCVYTLSMSLSECGFGVQLRGIVGISDATIPPVGVIQVGANIGLSDFNGFVIASVSWLRDINIGPNCLDDGAISLPAVSGEKQVAGTCDPNVGPAPDSLPLFGDATVTFS